jgi:hypothetical protein
MADVKYPISGSCQCGGVSYQLLAAPKAVVACHCRECQKLSTSAFSITAFVEEENIRFNGPLASWSRVADSGNVNDAAFCPTCGNRIYHYSKAQPGIIKLKPSNLDDTRIINPTRHVWVSEKQEWYQVPEGVEVFQHQP